jgi:dipeptidyl aminopeptidase/acylaminoacyl peptidase
MTADHERRVRSESMPLPPLIPRAVLFGEPARLSPALSPSGRQLAYLASHDGAFNIWVAALPAGRPGPRPVTADPSGILAFTWLNSDRYLLYIRDPDGAEKTRLGVVDLRCGQVRELAVGQETGWRIAGVSARGLVLAETYNAATGCFDVYRIDTAMGEPELAVHNPGFAVLASDCELRVRAAVRRDADGGATIMARPDEQAQWRAVYQAGPDDAAALRIISFTADGTALLITSSLDAPATRLLRLDLASGAVRHVYADPAGHDVTDVALHPGTREPRLAYVLRQRRDLEVLDPGIEEDIAALRRHTRGDVSLLGTDRGDRLWLVQDNCDNRPAAYRLYDRGTRRSRLLFTHLPQLERRRLARMEPFSFEARDGLVVHGYLTFPPGTDRRSLPTVLAVHGGPWYRNSWGFRGEPQWLANRGYLCVDVNFRGSAGYGKQFRNAGDREWGGRMQDDLIDALRVLISRGVTDRTRVAIYGASYGGYAALHAAAFTPELFRCAIAVAGPSDLRTFVASAGEAGNPVADELRRRVGDPVADAALLWSRSPLSRAGEIRIPLLIAQGANDPRVRRRESDQIVAALRAQGVPHEYLLFMDEGHGFMRSANQLTFYAAADRFLGIHLGGRCESEPAPNPAGLRAVFQ